MGMARDGQTVSSFFFLQCETLPEHFAECEQQQSSHNQRRIYGKNFRPPVQLKFHAFGYDSLKQKPINHPSVPVASPTGDRLINENHESEVAHITCVGLGKHLAALNVAAESPQQIYAHIEKKPG